MTSIEGTTPAGALPYGGWREWRVRRVLIGFVRARPLGAVSACVILAMAFAALFASVVSPYDPNLKNTALLLDGPTLSHPFGTDQLGRDVLTRVIYGARITLFIGLAVTAVSGGLGLAIGVTSGYFGGRVDRITVMLLDAMMAFPGLILAIALVTALGSSVLNVILAVLVGFTARVARLIRSNVLSVRSTAYVDAARATGATNVRLLVRHVVPNVVPLLIVLGSLNFGVAMLVEGSLSFLGLGPPPPTPSWGRMLSSEGQQFFRSAPWLGIFPGLVLAVAVFAFNLLGDALRDHLDPRLRGS